MQAEFLYTGEMQCGWKGEKYNCCYVVIALDTRDQLYAMKMVWRGNTPENNKAASAS